MSNRLITDDRISGNDWGPLGPRAESVAPTRGVTVVVCCGPDHKRLAPTLAALRHQDYPTDLLDVVVVAPAGTGDLPEPRPDRCRLVAAGDPHTGGGFDAGVAAGTGDIVVRLEAGVICAPGFVTALVRWQHASPAAVSLAPPARLTQGWGEAAGVADAAAGGELASLFPEGSVAVDTELATLLATTHDLRTAGRRAFHAVRGVPFAFHRSYHVDGDNPYRGDDVEVGYRLAQAGAVFVPEPAARAWVLPGDDDAARTRLRQAVLPDLVPYPRHLRPGGRIWSVPLVTAVVPADGPYEVVRACVDRLLGSDESDLRVLLVGDWRGAGSADQRLLAVEYRSDSRVGLVDTEPDTAFPSPYLLRVPSRLGLGGGTLTALVDASERWQAGLVRVMPAGAASAAHAVELWSTAARARALRAGVPAAKLAATVAATHGQRWETGSEFDVVDLATLPPDQLASATGRNEPEPADGGDEQIVPVGGARSLAKATAFVARRYAGAAKRRVVRR